MGVRGDAIMQMDWTTAQVVNQLKKLNLDKETIIIFTSDNGPVLNDGYEDLSAELVGNHKPGGVYRGGKYSAFEAGTRVPLIITWPGRIKGQTSDALVNQLDFYRSFAALLDLPVEKSEAIDSENHWKTFTGEIATGRKWMLEESFTLSARQDNWKYIAPMPPENKVPAFMANKGIESGVSKQAQLYNLKNDPSEKNNLAEKNPDIVKSMQAYIDAVKKRK